MATKLERIVALVSDINRGTYPTVAGLCAKYEIKDRTFHDDIGFIRDRMGIEILFDRNKGGYYNSTPDRKLPDFDISENELLALTLGKDLLVEHSGPAFRLHLDEALRKIASRLANKECISVEEIRSIMRFMPGGVANTDGKVLLELRDACTRNKTVEIDYFTASTGQTSTRKIDPYRIIEHNGAWYSAAWCHERKEMRKFAIHRIQRHKVLKDSFQIAENVDVDSWLNAAFMLEHCDGEHLVRIRFTPVGARYAIERNWHPSQKIQKHADGSCTLEFTTQSFDEVKRWVLPFGAGAEVLDPPELRRRVKEELRLTLQSYS